MCINKSEQFVYFQNKARHYDNIKKIKPHVNDQLEQQYLKAFDIKKEKKRFIPYLQQYSIQVQNQSLINRLVNISKTSRRQVSVQGAYSRYNKYQYNRQFRKKSPYKTQQKRNIQHGNQWLANKLIKTKPIIGTLSQWNKKHAEDMSFRKNSSRYITPQKSKGSLYIESDKFIPEHYRSFIAHQNSGSQTFRKSISVSKQQLFDLPNLPRLRQNPQDRYLKFSFDNKSKITL